MGISEENRDWAAWADRHGEQMYARTKNPYYVIEAVASARTVGWKQPEWALDALLDAVKDAYFSSHGPTKVVSLDAALGLKTGPGTAPPKLRAYKELNEGCVFQDVSLLLFCFDISIPMACELVYLEPDYQFAKEMSETITGAWVVEDEDLPRFGIRGMTREEFDRATSPRLQ